MRKIGLLVNVKIDCFSLLVESAMDQEISNMNSFRGSDILMQVIVFSTLYNFFGCYLQFQWPSICKIKWITMKTGKQLCLVPLPGKTVWHKNKYGCNDLRRQKENSNNNRWILVFSQKTIKGETSQTGQKDWRLFWCLKRGAVLLSGLSLLQDN